MKKIFTTVSSVLLGIFLCFAGIEKNLQQPDSGSLNGSLSGYVYKFGGTTPVEWATVEIAGLSDITDYSGYYFIDGIPAGVWDATASHPDYCDQVVSGIEISSGANVDQDFGLTWAWITTVPDPSSGIVVNLGENQTQLFPFFISNPGTCSLDYDFYFIDTSPGLAKENGKNSRKGESTEINFPGMEQFGGTNYMFTNGNVTIGNIYKVETQTLLNEHKLWMNVPALTQMWFLVYESTSFAGSYTLISASDVSPAGPGGPCWQSSGPVEVMMMPDHYYLICTSFEQTCSYYCDKDITPYPIPASFGTLVSSAGFDWIPATNFPPDPTQNVSLFIPEAVAFYQEIITNMGPVWCSLIENNYSGTVPPGSSETLTILFDATGLIQGTVKTGILTINSNAQNNNAISMNVNMTVGPPPVGSIDGYIVECETTIPVEGATVSLDDGVIPTQYTITGANGYYQFINVYLLYPITITAGKDGFCCSQVVIYPWDAAETAKLTGNIGNLCLTWAELEFQPQTLDVYVIGGQSEDFVINLTNPGSCELEYEGTVSFITDHHQTEMEPSNTESWLSITGGATGAILPFNNETAQMIVHFDAGEYPAGTVKSGEITINSNARWNPVQAIPVTMHVSQGEELNLKALLEGAYDPATGEMANELNPAGLLPFSQPYGPPLPYYGNPAPGWLYYGFESVAAISPDVVDWLLLEVRDAPDVQNATAATTEDILPAFLLNNGTLTKPEGNGNPITSAIIDYGMFVVVHHRNHVSIINPVPIPENAGVYTWDFTGGAYGAAPGAKEIAPGVWAMMGGDGNADNQINTQDKLDAWWNEAGSSGYRGSDFDMNGQTGNQDKLDIWQPNSGQSSQVPD